MSIDQIQELKSIIMNFRVSELNQLLQFCNQSKVGRKPVLQERALGLLKKDTLTQQIQFKIRELSYLQSGTSNKSSTSSIPDIPLAQDSSSNECTITEMNMLPMQVNHRIQKAIQNHFSMPKLNQFDLKNLNHNQTVKSYTTNVQFKPIPFDDFVSTIIDPTVLSSPLNKKGLNNYECSFKLKSEQASEISLSREFKAGKLEFNSQIHLRFCLAESFTPQDDHLPLNLNIRLNNKNIQLPTVIPNNKPNVESKRQSKPIDITPYCKLSPVSSNQLSIQWNQDVNSVSTKNYCFMIYLVKKLTSKDLLDKLNQKGIADSILTQKLIISKLSDNDNEISTTSLKGNLNCPLGKMRLRIPVRSTQCSHIQCFDAELYLQMNEKKPSWLCPVCDKKADYNTLFIDGLFTQILKETSTDSNEIEFSEDGSWKIVQNLNKTIVLTPQRRKIDEDTSCIKKSKTEEEEVIELSSDSDDDNENVLQPINMPKLNSFNDATKSINSINNPFSSSNQFSTSSLNNASRNQITRSNGSNFGSGFSLGTYHSTSNGSLNENNSNSTMLRGRILNSEPNVISLD